MGKADKGDFSNPGQDLPDYTNASNFTVQPPKIKDRQAVKVDPTPDAHTTTHRDPNGY